MKEPLSIKCRVIRTHMRNKRVFEVGDSITLDPTSAVEGLGTSLTFDLDKAELANLRKQLHSQSENLFAVSHSGSWLPQLLRAVNAALAPTIERPQPKICIPIVPYRAIHDGYGRHLEAGKVGKLGLVAAVELLRYRQAELPKATLRETYDLLMASRLRKDLSAAEGVAVAELITRVRVIAERTMIDQAMVA
jgi:hypothetical protein